MRIAMASAPARPGRANEDFAGAVPDAVVLFDGAGIPGAESVCRHGVAWYVTRLGGTLLGLLSLQAESGPRSLRAGSGVRSLQAGSGPRSLQGGSGLAELLADAIERVTGEHRDTCAVSDPISPSAAVAVLRRSGERVDHLVLGDCFIVLDRIDADPLVVTDQREVVVARAYQDVLEAGADRDAVLRELRARRNRPGGFWLAKDDPRAAAEAVTGSHPVTALAGAALLSNGASRIVDRFGLMGWPGVVAGEPAEVIRRVREAEARHAVAPDDATIAVVRFGPGKTRARNT